MRIVSTFQKVQQVVHKCPIRAFVSSQISMTANHTWISSLRMQFKRRDSTHMGRERLLTGTAVWQRIGR